MALFPDYIVDTLSSGLAGNPGGMPSWVPNPTNPPDIAINWTANQAWLKTTGLTTPAAIGITTTRASVKQVVDSNGNWTQVAANTTAISNLGRSTEEARTNLFLNSAVPATQTITVVNTSTYAVSVIGTGSLVLTDAMSATVTQGSPFIGAAGSASLTVTTSGVTGVFVNAQVELGASVTSPIITAGAAATRAGDTTVLTGQTFGSAYSMFSQATPQAPTAFAAAQTFLQLDNGTSAQRTLMRRASTATILVAAVGGTGANLTPAGTLAQNTQAKLASSWAAGAQAGCSNGGTVVTAAGAALPTTPTEVCFGHNVGNERLDGLGAIDAIWLTQAITSAQLQAITT